MFKYRGAFIFMAIAIVQVIVIHATFAGTVLWPFNGYMTFGMGLISMFIVGLLFANQRNALDSANMARKQIKLAYHQQWQLNNLKDAFLVNVSHELRTPLTEVNGYLELLRDHHEQLDPGLQMTFVNNAVHGCDELLSMTIGILDAIDADQKMKPLQMKELSVSKLVHTVLEHFDPLLKQEHAIHLDIPEELCIWAESQRTCQILRNLLSNACKYSAPHTSIFIKACQSEVGSGKTASSQVCISVQDKGHGIPKDEIPLLFGRFVRLKRDLSGTIRGSGLGLYICKQLVEEMDGSIWVESSGKEGEGCCFHFMVPCVSASSGRTSDSAKVHAHAMSIPQSA